MHREADCFELRLKMSTNSDFAEKKNTKDWKKMSRLTFDVMCDFPVLKKIGLASFPDNPTFNLRTLREYLHNHYDINTDCSLSYFDNENDLVCINSECEFLEACKVAREFREENKYLIMLISKRTFNKYPFGYKDFDNLSTKPYSMKEWIKSMKTQKDDNKKYDIKYESIQKRNQRDLNNLKSSSIFPKRRAISSLLKSKAVVTNKIESKSGASKTEEDHCEKVLNDARVTFAISDKSAEWIHHNGQLITPSKPKSTTDKAEEEQNEKDLSNSITSSNTVLPEKSTVISQSKVKATVTNQMESTNPPIWFEEYMKTMKEDMIKEISSQVTATVTEILNTFATNLSTKLQSTQTKVESIPVSTPVMQYSSDDDILCLYPEKKQYKKKKKVTNKLCTDNMPSNQVEVLSRLENLEEKVRTITDKQDYYHLVTKMVNNLDKGCKEQENVNTHENCVRQEILSNVNLPLDAQTDQNSYNASKCIDNELRMNCSITGHQMLDNAKAGMFCSSLDLDNVSICGDISNSDPQDSDQYNFEIIQMPMQCELNSFDSRKCTDKGEQKVENIYEKTLPDTENANFTFHTAENNLSGRDSPSFELLSESPSPPVSIYMDNDHFSINENDSTCATSATPVTDSIEKVYNDESKTEYIYVIGADGKIYDKYLLDDAREHDDENTQFKLEKRMDGVYSFTSRILPASMTENDSECVSESAEHKCENDSNIDVKSSHTSYTIKKGNIDWSKTSQYNCHLQTELNDFAQSFHSHTTSVTDDEDSAANPTININVDVATAATTQSKEDDSSKTDLKYNKNIETNDDVRTSENVRACPNRTFDFSTQHAANRSLGTDGHELNGDPSVHMVQALSQALPETLVTGAESVAVFALGTAVDAFDKLLALLKDDRIKRRSYRRAQ